jgi:hypothetical protein
MKVIIILLNTFHIIAIKYKLVLQLILNEIVNKVKKIT